MAPCTSRPSRGWALCASTLTAQSFARPSLLEVDLPPAQFAADGALWAGDLDGDGLPIALLFTHRT